MVRKKQKSDKSTIIDVSRETGVSLATVSRVLNNSPKVTPETRRKVADAIKRLNYKPNAAARHLSGRKTHTLGVVFHQLTSGFYASVMSGIELQARTAGFHVLVTISRHDDPDRNRFFDMLDEARVDALIILDSTLPPATLTKLSSYKRPLVLIQKECADPGVATVLSTDEEAARNALAHLLALGRDRVLLVAGPDDAEDSHLRMEGCRRALREHDMTLRNVDVILGSYSAHDALMAFRAYRDKEGVPGAVFAFNDDMALSIMKELRLTGVGVPDQTAVVGFDGIDAADYMGLTTVQVPMLDLGREAVRLAVQRISQPALPPGHAVVKCELVLRESTPPLP